MLYVAVALIALILAGFLYGRIVSARTLKVNPAPGQLVDLGTHRLHIQCMGENGPTVVLDHGAGSLGLLWSLVAPAVAQFARVVIVDRAGYGWSDPGPMPRTSEKASQELNAALSKAGIPGPYILVGHSFGGLNARVFASKFAAEVSGLVLVDATHEDELTERFPAEHVKGQRMLPKMMRVMAMLGNLGLLQLLAKLEKLGDISALAKRFPLAVGRLLVKLAIRPSALAAAASEFETIEESYAVVRAGGALGDRPLVVLVHGQPGPVAPGTSPEVAQRIEALMHELAAEMAGLSTSGKLVVAQKSGHEIHVTEPDLVVEAIREVVAEVQRRQIESA